jgi:gliding motility-associated protein GldE
MFLPANLKKNILETLPEFFTLFANLTFNRPTIAGIVELVIFAILIIMSALVSGSEVAFFSLNPKNLDYLKKSSQKSHKRILKLLEKPDYLLATILISNNFINITIVVLSTYITASMIEFHSEALKFAFEAILVTFIILLFGEIIPKIYANKYKLRFAALMASPLNFAGKLFLPLCLLLVRYSNIVNKKMQKKDKLVMSDISYAIDITSGHTQNEKKILKSVVNFSNIEVREIMTPRVDVVTVNYNDKLSNVKQIISKNEFSRLPVIKDSLDNIAGILYIKDLVKILTKDNYYEWQKYIKPAYFVPENKKIDDLLQEFRNKKIHIAVVSDEYGGFSGIITLEDIIEEIVGEINDEFDLPEDLISKTGENKYIVDGKLLLNDFEKYLNLPENFFAEIKGDAETIAGLLLEIKGEFPKIQQNIFYKNLKFTILEINKRRIVKVKVTLTNQ